jgi:hypothetical protein
MDPETARLWLAFEAGNLPKLMSMSVQARTGSSSLLSMFNTNGVDNDNGGGLRLQRLLPLPLVD